MGWRKNYKRRSSTAVAAPVAYSSTQRTAKAQFINHTADSVRIKHCELLTSVTGSNNFTIDANIGAFKINPGLLQSFPWLATQGAAWEKYKFHNLKFIYHTKCATSVPGSVLLGMDYDAADVAPTTEQELSNMYGSVESAPWKEIVFQCDMARMQQSRYIRTSNNTGVGGTDIKTYDQGTFYVGTVDGTAVPWGKLWVEYDVELQIPQQAPVTGLGVYFAAVSSTANLFPVLSGGDAAVIRSKNYNITIDGDPIVANRLNISGLVVGKLYELELIVRGTTLTVLSATMTEVNVFNRTLTSLDQTTIMISGSWLATMPSFILQVTGVVSASVNKSAMSVWQIPALIYTS